MGDMSDENGFTPKKERPDDEDCGGCGGRFCRTRHFKIMIEVSLIDLFSRNANGLGSINL